MGKSDREDPKGLWLDGGGRLLIEDDGYWVMGPDQSVIVSRGPEILLQASIVQYGEKTDEGMLIRAIALPWLEILKELVRNPDFLFEFARSPRKFEEFIAGAYRKEGWDEVVLTPSSGDKGRDVIAVKSGYFSIRILDQAKAYSSGRLVRHNDVRAMLGVLSSDQNVSKGLITTTSAFEPGILSSDEFKRFMPHRLELKSGKQLLEWLAKIREATAADRDQFRPRNQS
jgi:restriction system protein